MIPTRRICNSSQIRKWTMLRTTLKSLQWRNPKRFLSFDKLAKKCKEWMYFFKLWCLHRKEKLVETFAKEGLSMAASLQALIEESKAGFNFSLCISNSFSNSGELSQALNLTKNFSSDNRNVAFSLFIIWTASEGNLLFLRFFIIK